jgi:hypothetical protein
MKGDAFCTGDKRVMSSVHHMSEANHTPQGESPEQCESLNKFDNNIANKASKNEIPNPTF